MHIRLKKPRVKRVQRPRPIPPPVPPRPKRSILRTIYKDLVCTDRDQRVETLKKAMHWYEGLEAYLAYQSKWTLAQQRAGVAAEGFRLSGLKSNKDEHKEESYLKAIRAYEKMMQKYHPPKIGSFISKFSHVRSKLEKRRRRFSGKFYEYLAFVGEVLRPVNYENLRIKLHVDKLGWKYVINSEGDVTFDAKFLDESRRVTRKQGLLPGVMLLLPVLTQAASQSMEKDASHFRTGRYIIHGDVRYAAMHNMIQNLIRYCMTDESPKKLIRHAHTTSVESTTAA